MKITSSILVTFAPLFMITTWADETPTEIESHAPLYFEVGEQRVLRFPQLLRFSVSGDGIRYTRMGDQLLLKAGKPGLGQIQVFQGKDPASGHWIERKIRIENRSAAGASRELLQGLSQLHSLEVIHTGKQYLIRGAVRDLREAAVVAHLREQFSGQVVDEVEIEASAFEKAKASFHSLLTQYDSKNNSMKMFASPEGFLFSGALENAASAQAFEKSAKRIHPLSRFSIQTIKDPQATLYFKTYLLEMKRETIRSLGVTWPTQHAMTLTLPHFSYSGIAYQGQPHLESSIQALSSKGQLKVLSSPELVVRCPGQAELFAGGELPIRTTSRFNDQVLWKNFGLSLKLETQEFSGEKVRLNISTELSHLDSSIGQDKIPGLQSNRMKTQVDATLGRPLLLSGLLQDDLRKRVTGLPGLMDIPILGHLFSSEDYQEARSELVAILLPSREAPREPMARIESGIPKGFLPIPRQPISAEALDALRSDENFPWNALKE